MRPTPLLAALALSLLPLPAAADDLPAAIAVPGKRLVAVVHAVGAQVYQCEFNSVGKLVWQFREPIATLLVGGRTVGRHYAGPSWEMTDGSALSAKVVASTASAGPADIPLLKLDVTARRGSGELAGVTTIQRLNTKGGATNGDCHQHGALLSVPYTADYAFYRRD